MKKIGSLPSSLDYFIAGAVGLAAFAVYTRTLVPGLLPSDGAEFQTLGYVLDHAHTTGYHVYLILAKLFTFLPVGDIAYRVNLFSAFMGGLTVMLVYLAARILSGSRWGAALGALVLAVSGTFWSQAIIAEVYTAGTVFTAAIVYFVLRWNLTRRGVDLFTAAALLGMGTGVHGSVVLLGPGIGLLLLLNHGEFRHTWKPALGGGLAGLLLLVLAFAVVDAREGNASIMNTYSTSATRWGVQPEELETPAGRFLFLVFARQWRTEMFVDPGEVVPDNSEKLVQALGEDFSLLALMLSLFGLVGLFFQRWKLGVFFSAALAAHLVYTLNYRIGDIYVFYLSFYVYIAILAAQGTGFFLDLLKRLPGVRFLRPIFGAVIIGLCLLPFGEARVEALEKGEIRFDFMGLASNRELEGWRDWIREVTPGFPKNAVVMGGWYNLYGFAYTAQVELERTDLMFIEAYPFSSQGGMASSLPVFLREKIEDGSPVYAFDFLDELVGRGFRASRVILANTTVYKYELP